MLATVDEQQDTADSADERIRMIIDTDEVVREAIALRAMKETRRLRRHVPKSEVATKILRGEWEGLAAEIAELQGWDQPPPKGKKK